MTNVRKQAISIILGQIARIEHEGAPEEFYRTRPRLRSLAKAIQRGKRHPLLRAHMIKIVARERLYEENSRIQKADERVLKIFGAVHWGRLSIEDFYPSLQVLGVNTQRLQQLSRRIEIAGAKAPRELW